MKEMEITDEMKMKLAVSEAQILMDVMARVAHPNIMEIKKVYHIGDRFYLIFPLCEGGELIQRVREKVRFTEPAAALVLRDLISALHAMHTNNILHLDIKPENILYETKEENSRIKVTDFGLSTLLCDSRPYEMIQQQKLGDKKPPTVEQMDAIMANFDMHTFCAAEGVCGTVGFISPEMILTGFRSKAADVFAAGVVFYIMLSGYAPFDALTDRKTIAKTLYGKISVIDS